MKHTTYCKLCGRLRDAFACQDCYDKDTEELQAINDSLLAVLEALTDHCCYMNNMQHAGQDMLPIDWSTLYDLQNKARDAIKKATNV